MIFPRFFYDDDAGEGGGGDTTTTATKAAETAVNTEQFFTADEAKEFGFDSKESLKTFIAQSKSQNRPDEEKQKEAEIEKTNFLKYSAENNLLKLEDYNQHENLKSKPDKDLVYEKFVTEFKEDNPDIDPVDFDAEVKFAFDNEYKLNSDNEKAKARGEVRLKKDASDLRNPSEQKFKTATEKFNEYKTTAKVYPEFDKFINDVITENTPDKFTVKVKDGETEIPVEIDLTPEQRTELQKLFKTPKYFSNYIKGEKKDELKAAIAKKINGYIKVNNFDAVVTKSYTTGIGIGTKKGSNIGAENLFGTQAGGQNNGAASADISKTLAENNSKMDKARRNNR